MKKVKLGRSPSNALQHGAFGGTVLLPDEDASQFRRLHRDLVAEWSPSGPAEADAVYSLAQSIGRKRAIPNCASRSRPGIASS